MCSYQRRASARTRLSRAPLALGALAAGSKLRLAATATAMLFLLFAPFRFLVFTFPQAACVRGRRGRICFRLLRLFDLNCEVASFPTLGIGPIKREHHFAARL